MQPSESAGQFLPIPDMIRAHADARPNATALVLDERVLSYSERDAVMDRVAAALQREGVPPGQSIAICAGTSIEYASAFLGALRAGVVVAPMALSPRFHEQCATAPANVVAENGRVISTSSYGSARCHAAFIVDIIDYAPDVDADHTGHPVVSWADPTPYPQTYRKL